MTKGMIPCKFPRYEYFSILPPRPAGSNRHPAPAMAGSATSPTHSKAHGVHIRNMDLIPPESFQFDNFYMCA